MAPGSLAAGPPEGGSTLPALLYLSRGDVEELGIAVADIIRDLEAAFAAKGRGEVEMPPKPGIHPRPDAFIHAMPAYLRSGDVAGLKWIAGYPDNPAHGLPYISGLLILNDAGTGIPLAVMDATWITAVRTGAATAVAAKYLARPDATRLGMIGCGVQGRSNLDALVAVQPRLAEVLAYDINPAAAQAYAEYARARHDLPVTVCRTPEDAVREADIVVTATPIRRHPTPVIAAAWLRAGVFLCTLDFDSAVTPEAFAAADLLCSDDVAQLDHYREEGYFGGVPARVIDLGAVVAGRTPGRPDAAARIISIHLGLALADVVTARRIYESAWAAGAGRELEL